MLKDPDELVGSILISLGQEVRPFTNKQIELVTELRRPSRHRHREHAAAQRAARSLAAADRDRPMRSRSSAARRLILQMVLQTLVELKLLGSVMPITPPYYFAKKMGHFFYSAPRLTASRANLCDSLVQDIPIKAERGSASSGVRCSKGRVVHIPDVKVDPEYPLGARAQRLGDYRTIVGVPNATRR